MCQSVSLTETGGSAQFVGGSSDGNCSVLAVTLDGLQPGPQEVGVLRRSAIRRDLLYRVDIDSPGWRACEQLFVTSACMDYREGSDVRPTRPCG